MLAIDTQTSAFGEGDMPVTVVLNAPHHYRLQRLRDRLGAVVGGGLIAVGLVASVIVGLITLAAPILFVAERLSPTAAPMSVPWQGIGVAWVLAAGIAVGAFNSGFRQLTGEPRLVLFLRRFGYQDATKAISLAATRKTGRAWRVITLDDSEIAPVGLPTPLKAIDHSAAYVATLRRRVRRAFKLVFGFPMHRLPLIALGASTVVVAASFGRLTIANLESTARHYAFLVLGPLEGKAPIPPLGFDLQTAFLVLAAIAVIGIAGWVLAIVAVLLGLALFAPMLAVGKIFGDLARAENLQRFGIGADVDVARGVAAIKLASKQLFAPGLMVVSVTPALWRQSVVSLAEASAVVLVDVSEPTTHLLWEVTQLSPLRPKFVFVGREDRARAIASAAQRSNSQKVDRELASMLEGQQILAYGTSDKDLLRFATELVDTFQARVP